ncbi:MAG: hypothetical protein CMN56_11080 [Sneathiella sp.]|nr:hypothetical protein [Sneathiella sp.]
MIPIPSPAGVVRRIDGDGTMTTHNPIVLNAGQVAEQLGLSESTLAKMRLSGDGPPYSKLGRRVVYRPEDIDAWIASNSFRSTSEYGQVK